METRPPSNNIGQAWITLLISVTYLGKFPFFSSGSGTRFSLTSLTEGRWIASKLTLHGAWIINHKRYKLVVRSVRSPALPSRFSRYPQRKDLRFLCGNRSGKWYSSLPSLSSSRTSPRSSMVCVNVRHTGVGSMHIECETLRKISKENFRFPIGVL